MTSSSLRTSQVGAAHLILQAARALGVPLPSPESEDKFLRQVRHVGFGLSDEDYFLSLVNWFGRCRAGHMLGQAPIGNAATSVAVPDLLLHLGMGDSKITFLVEVKGTEDCELSLDVPYVRRLQAYADLVQLPILVAWRPRAFNRWMLFDPTIGEIHDEIYRYDLTAALKADLMGLLVGDRMVKFLPGVGLSVEMKVVGERVPSSDGFIQNFQISKARAHNTGGAPLPALPPGMLWLILASAIADSRVEDCTATWSLLTGEAGCFLQDGFRFRALMASYGDDAIHWRELGTKFAADSSGIALLNALSSSVGQYVHSIGLLVPSSTPSFIPNTWPGLHS